MKLLAIVLVFALASAWANEEENEKVNDLKEQGLNDGEARKVAHENENVKGKLKKCKMALASKNRHKREAQDGADAPEDPVQDMTPEELDDALEECLKELKGEDTKLKVVDAHLRRKRAAPFNCKNREQLLWKHGTVYVDVSSIYRNDDQMRAVKCMVKEYASHKMLKFWNFKIVGDRGYGGCGSGARAKDNCMKVVTTPNLGARSCNGHSHVGYTGSLGEKPHLLHISRCTLYDKAPEEMLCPIAVHEGMHGLGINHEQSRTDRDNYQRIDESAILPGSEHNYDKLTRIEEYTAGAGNYDCMSIMHYKPWTLAKQGRTVINMNSKQMQDCIKKKKLHMSAGDVQGLYNLYHCGRATHCFVDKNNEIKEGQAAQGQKMWDGAQFGLNGGVYAGKVCSRDQSGMLGITTGGVVVGGRFYKSGQCIASASKWSGLKITITQRGGRANFQAQGGCARRG